MNEFIEGMRILFTEGFDKTSKFIFDFYDFDRDGHICREDVRIVLSYISLSVNCASPKKDPSNRFNLFYDIDLQDNKIDVTNRHDSLQFQNGGSSIIPSYKDRVESQEELYELIEKFFKEKEYIDFKKFLYNIENVSSEIYFYIMAFLLEKKPFVKTNILEYEKQITNRISSNLTNRNNFNTFIEKTSNIFGKKSYLIASPNLKSKLSPSIILSKSPVIKNIFGGFPTEKFDLKVNLADSQKSSSLRDLNNLNVNNIHNFSSNNLLDIKKIRGLDNYFDNLNQKMDDENKNNFIYNLKSEEENLVNMTDNFNYNIIDSNGCISNSTNSNINIILPRKNCPIFNHGKEVKNENGNNNLKIIHESPIRKKNERSLPIKSKITGGGNKSKQDPIIQNIFPDNLGLNNNLVNHYNNLNQINSNYIMKEGNVHSNHGNLPLGIGYHSSSLHRKNFGDHGNNFVFNNNYTHNIPMNSNQINTNLKKNSLIKKNDKDCYFSNSIKNISNRNYSKNNQDFELQKVLTERNLKKKINFESIINMEAEEEEDSDSGDEKNTVKTKGFLYKLTDVNKLKKLWFYLVHRDLYYFKNELDNQHKGMHNLSGIFLKEEKIQVIGGSPYFCFGIVYPKKTRYYFTEKEEDYKKWINAIKKIIGYSDLNDIYELKDKLGNGKFGLVRLGIHKYTNEKFAIKIMSKKEMNNEDLELVKTEIEILKICQHPNIIRLYDVVENIDYIFIVMEYCSGNDLFTYLQRRSFKIPEIRAANIIHKLSTAIFYIHSYGIVHRDLKPENILMTDNSDEADIRLLDFGLSKIIGPTQLCREPYGTLSYVAPEVLTEKPYSKSVDLWSIGITTYLLLCSRLPFDDPKSEREIARQTVNDPIPKNNNGWKNTSNDARDLIENLLQKDPCKRYSIKQVLEHSWIQRHTKPEITEMRRRSNFQKLFSFQFYSSSDNCHHTN